MGGYGAGSAIFGPLAQLKLIPTYGLPATFQILGAIFLVMTMVGAVLLRNPPAGYRPSCHPFGIFRSRRGWRAAPRLCCA